MASGFRLIFATSLLLALLGLFLFLVSSASSSLFLSFRFSFFLSFFLSNVQWGSMLMVFQVFELKFLCTRSDFSRLPYLDLCFHKVIFFGYQWRLDFLDQSTHTYIKETRKCRCVFFQVTTFAPLLVIWTFGVECCDP